jgi:enoyl-CoA hydratase/carnithine racemase
MGGGLPDVCGLGVVNGVLRSDELLPYVTKFTRELIASVSPVSLSETKAKIYTDLHCDVGSSVVASRAHIGRMVKEPDFAEGVAAFLGKRPPRWSKR